MNFSNSTTDKTERLKDKHTLADQWESIDWTQVQKDVNRLQTRPELKHQDYFKEARGILKLFKFKNPLV